MPSPAPILPSRLNALPRIIPFLVLGFVLGAGYTAKAAQWFVSGQGSDDNDGQSEATAFRTLQKAADLVQPGDVVLIGDGTYTDDSPATDSSVVRLHRSGTPEAWITWKAGAGAQPVLRPRGWNGILITASYQIVEGLTVIGSNDEIVLTDALADAKKEKPTPHFNTNGIYVNGRLSGPNDKPHHVIIRRCTVAKNSCGGIIAIEADYVTIQDNLVYENAWYARYASSGISTLNNWRHDDAPGYHIVIERNLVWNNKSLVPWEKTGKLSDGNGIILDVTDIRPTGGATNPNADAPVALNPTGDSTTPAAPAAAPTPTSTKPPRPEWKGRSLVANNVSAFNGGSGIHTFRTRQVDIINNTTYWNGGVVGYQEIFANRSEDVVILNNIMVPRPGGKVTSDNRNVKVRWDYNLSSVPAGHFETAQNVVADPQFVRIDPDLRRADFRLRDSSPGRDSGTDDVAQATDATGAKRPVGQGRDRGAYEQ